MAYCRRLLSARVRHQPGPVSSNLTGSAITGAWQSTADCTGLENRQGSHPRGFESHRSRHRRRSSEAEQRFRKPQAVGSIPTAGSTISPKPERDPIRSSRFHQPTHPVVAGNRSTSAAAHQRGHRLAMPPVNQQRSPTWDTRSVRHRQDDAPGYPPERRRRNSTYYLARVPIRPNDGNTQDTRNHFRIRNRNTIQNRTLCQNTTPNPTANST